VNSGDQRSKQVKQVSKQGDKVQAVRQSSGRRRSQRISMGGTDGANMLFGGDSAGMNWGFRSVCFLLRSYSDVSVSGRWG